MILTVDQAFKEHRPFYVKFFQGNGYYPVSKFAWSEKEQKWERFTEKIDGKGQRYWRSDGFPGAFEVTNEEFIRYTLEHMAVVISDIDMTNNRVFSRTLEIQ